MKSVSPEVIKIDFKKKRRKANYNTARHILKESMVAKALEIAAPQLQKDKYMCRTIVNQVLRRVDSLFSSYEEGQQSINERLQPDQVPAIDLSLVFQNSVQDILHLHDVKRHKKCIIKMQPKVKMEEQRQHIDAIVSILIAQISWVNEKDEHK